MCTLYVHIYIVNTYSISKMLWVVSNLFQPHRRKKIGHLATFRGTPPMTGMIYDKTAGVSYWDVDPKGTNSGAFSPNPIKPSACSGMRMTGDENAKKQ